MPCVPDDMSAAAVERRVKLAAAMRAEEAARAEASPIVPSKSRIAKGR